MGGAATGGGRHQGDRARWIADVPPACVVEMEAAAAQVCLRNVRVPLMALKSVSRLRGSHHNIYFVPKAMKDLKRGSHEFGTWDDVVALCGRKGWACPRGKNEDFAKQSRLLTTRDAALLYLISRFWSSAAPDAPDSESVLKERQVQQLMQAIIVTGGSSITSARVTPCSSIVGRERRRCRGFRSGPGHRGR